MAQLIVRNLEEDVKNRLKQRALRHGQSVEEEVRDILRNATKGEGRRREGIGSAIRRQFQDFGFRENIPELKGSSPKTTTFDP